jgi:hypothetical protein
MSGGSTFSAPLRATTSIGRAAISISWSSFSPFPPAAYADAFFGLKESLEQLFARRADLVADAAIRNPYFRETVDRTRALLYAA